MTTPSPGGTAEECVVRHRIHSDSAVPPGLQATRYTFPSNELLGSSHASLRDVPANRCYNHVEYGAAIPQRQRAWSHSHDRFSALPPGGRPDSSPAIYRWVAS